MTGGLSDHDRNGQLVREALATLRDPARAEFQERAAFRTLAAVAPELLAERDDAQAKVATVMEHHYEDGGQCVSCRDENDNPADWPCPTAVAAVGGSVPTPEGGQR